MPCHNHPASLVDECSMPIWVTMLMSSSGTNHVLNSHEDSGQYGPYATVFEIMPCCTYPASLVNSFDNLIESSCKWDNLALIISLMTSKTWTHNLGKLINSGHYHYQCVPNFKVIHPRLFELKILQMADNWLQVASTWNHNIPWSFE